MTDLPDPEAEAARLGANIDQSTAGLRGIGKGLAAMHAELVPAVGRRNATRIIRDIAHEFAAGTFQKSPDLSSILRGGR